MQSQLPPAFPSSPTRPPRFSIRFDSPHTEMHLLSFYSEYAALAFLNLCFSPADLGKLRWKNSRQATTQGNIVISCDQLEDLLEYEMTRTEEAYQLPQPYPMYAQKITGKQVEVPNPMAESLGKAITKKAKRAAQKASKPKKQSKTGHKTASDLADAVGLPAPAIRRFLRSLLVERPYEWNEEQFEVLVSKIKAKAK